MPTWQVLFCAFLQASVCIPCSRLCVSCAHVGWGLGGTMSDGLQLGQLVVVWTSASPLDGAGVSVSVPPLWHFERM